MGAYVLRQTSRISVESLWRTTAISANTPDASGLNGFLGMKKQMQVHGTSPPKPQQGMGSCRSEGGEGESTSLCRGSTDYGSLSRTQPPAE
ncbi:predicted protein [Pyrenophora tritici-repentis Pt-1C-BFP]|uniref:Uncharacterized protein n=1 Tax=Pyrenophora tritici-repentis (strain Pt-1C-BFP) TaxID=426418 RepID=B2VTL3_PYRTR|nr:uncharacterized protein PTRG_00858 [Pyrenophora tritici-repentis Pt-1C-BFP]EDU40296.1 predicted protein [Pyrenophora tritici-repentis Pt-1C-BFP]